MEKEDTVNESNDEKYPSIDDTFDKLLEKTENKNQRIERCIKELGQITVGYLENEHGFLDRRDFALSVLYIKETLEMLKEQ